MLDTIKVGLLRLDTRGLPYGYMRIVPKDDPDGEIQNFLQVPIHVVFDKEGYNTYKEYLQKQNTEFKTWVHTITLKVPPILSLQNPEHCQHYPNAGHEWFLGNVRNLAAEFSNFPSSIKSYVEEAIREYTKIKKELASMPHMVEEDDYEPPPMDQAQTMAASKAIQLYGMLQRSRFDPGLRKPSEFAIPPFCRGKNDKTAKEVIEDVATIVADYVWKNPKVSKYSETEGAGLKIKLTILFLECFYKEHVRFMKTKLEHDLKDCKDGQDK
jgi:hypothetical protein